jgi:hypothetical protein
MQRFPKIISLVLLAVGILLGCQELGIPAGPETDVLAAKKGRKPAPSFLMPITVTFEDRSGDRVRSDTAQANGSNVYIDGVDLVTAEITSNDFTFSTAPGKKNEQPIRFLCFDFAGQADAPFQQETCVRGEMSTDGDGHQIHLMEPGGGPVNTNLVVGFSDASSSNIIYRLVFDESNKVTFTLTGSNTWTLQTPGTAMLYRVSSRSGKGKQTLEPVGPMEMPFFLTLERLPVASVDVSPGSAEIAPGQTVQLTATVRDAAGNELTDRPVSWSSSAPVVASVSGDGLVTGQSAGGATITATSEGQSGTVAVTVDPTGPASVLAFPGAEGFGKFAKGGRGGNVYTVSHLDDGGPGSLRECVEASGPRTCVFRVAGTIVLNSSLDVANPYLTIAGQTAPGGGITLKTADSLSKAHLRVRTNDVIVRYIRSRPGTKVENGRALTVSNGTAAHDVIVDHMSMSWAGDEIYISWEDTQNITVQWSNMSESLPAGDGGYKGPNLGSEGASGNFSFHHNLIAHHNQRYPLVTITYPLDWVNNVVYNLGTYGYANVRGPSKVNFVSNYIKSGPNATINTYVRENNISGGGYYHSGNYIEPGGSVQSFAPDNFRVSTPYSVSPVITTSAQQAFEDVLTQSGAIHGLNCDGTWFARPDPVDSRIVNSVRDGTRGHNIPIAQTVNQRGFLSSPADVGGWPQLDPGTPCAGQRSESKC